MNKNIINIGLVSKGRLFLESQKLLKSKKLHIYSERGERELIGKIKGKPNLIVYISCSGTLRTTLIWKLRYSNKWIRSLKRVRN